MFRCVVLLGLLVVRMAAAPADPAARLESLSRLIRDESPKVRLEALRALAKIPTAKSAELALSVLDQPMDPTLDYALWLTINDLSEPWIAAFESGEWKPEGREKQLEFALKAIKPEQASRVLSRTLASRPLTHDGSGPWIELIGQAGSPKELRLLFEQTLSGGFDAPASTRALRALAEASRLRKLKPDGDTSRLGTLLASTTSPESVRVEALRLAGQWKDLGAAFGRLGEIAGAAESSPALRAAAFEALRQIGGSGALEALTALAKPDRDASVRRGAAAALTALDVNRGAGVVVDVAKSLNDEPQAQEFWRAVLPVKGAGKAIAENLAATTSLPQPCARAGMRVAREGGRNDLELVLALAKAAGLAADTQAFSTQIIKELAAKASSQGNPVRGESIYRRTDLACMTCHAIGGAGGKVGPDLTSIGASAPIDYLVESVLLPNAKIKEGYHGVMVSTKDGQELSGTVVRESPQELVLRSVDNKEVSIAKNNIERRDNAPNSLMPTGVLDNLPEREQLDLFAFLSNLGKPGDFDASKGGVARRWRIYTFTHTDQQHGLGDRVWSTSFDDRMWSPVYSLASGRLTKGALEEASRREFWVGTLAVFAATELQTTTAGPCKLKLEATAGELWIDGQRIGATGEWTANLPAGTHRVLVRLDPKNVPESVRLTASDGSFVLN